MFLHSWQCYRSTTAYWGREINIWTFMRGSSVSLKRRWKKRDISIKVIVFPHWMNLADLWKSITIHSGKNCENWNKMMIIIFIFNFFNVNVNFTFENVALLVEQIITLLFHPCYPNWLLRPFAGIWLLCSWKYNELFWWCLLERENYKPLCFSAVYINASWQRWLPGGTSCSLSMLP